MIINYTQVQSITLTDADQFVLQYMLGMIGQGHGHRRVRGSVPAVKYIRMQYGLGLVEARDVVLEFEKTAV